MTTTLSLDERLQLLDSYGKLLLSKQLELMLCVVANYNHVQDLGQLEDLFDHYQSSPHTRFEPNRIEVFKIALVICRTTRNSHYQYHLFTSPEYQDRHNHLTSVIDTYFPEVRDNKHWWNVKATALV